MYHIKVAFVWLGVNTSIVFFATEIFRRVCDKLEKDFLREKGVVTETQSDLGKMLAVVVLLS